MEATIGSSALITASPSGHDVLHNHALEHREVLDRGDVVEARYGRRSRCW